MNNQPRIMLTVIFVFVLFGTLYGFYDMNRIINSAESDNGIPCEDGEYDLIMQDGSHSGCTPLSIDVNESPPKQTPIINLDYNNATEITRLEYVVDTNSLILNNMTNVSYHNVVFHSVYWNDIEHEPRYYVETIHNIECEVYVYIGEKACGEITYSIHHMYVGSQISDNIERIANKYTDK